MLCVLISTLNIQLLCRRSIDFPELAIFASRLGAMINLHWLEHFSMVPKVYEPLKFDCICCFTFFQVVRPIIRRPIVRRIVRPIYRPIIRRVVRPIIRPVIRRPVVRPFDPSINAGTGGIAFPRRAIGGKPRKRYNYY